MSYYRLYLLDESGSIRHCIDFDAADDGHAIVKATNLQGDYDAMELWHLARIVKRWPSAPS